MYKTDKPKKPRKTTRGYRKKQRSTSIYFLLWAIFSALSLVIVLVFGVTQQLLMGQSYKSEASQELAEKGEKIRVHIQTRPPDSFGGNASGYIHILEMEYDVRIFILSEDGRRILPQEPNVYMTDPDIQSYFDFTEEMKELKKRLEKSSTDFAVYEGEGEYVYGCEVVLYEGSAWYLYVGKSLSLMETAIARMNARMVLTAVFVLLLAFATSSAVSGWLTKPISEMTEKARKLAEGDFGVDFQGADYGKEMVELADTLNFAREELSKTDRMQKELIANVSHDFKTPLTMIKAYASMIIEISGNNPEKRNKHAQVIVDEADRLASLVGDVLDLSKISSGITPLEMTKFNASAYLYEILDRFAYLKETQDYQFVVDIDDGLYTRADKLKIGQVLYNLIGNAVNYTGEDKTVFISLKKQTAESFRFSVRDTGKGIKPEEINEIWDRYYRSSEAHKRPVQGTGLGLSIVKTILQRHTLPFGVESEQGKGSTFYVEFVTTKEN